MIMKIIIIIAIECHILRLNAPNSIYWLLFFIYQSLFINTLVDHAYSNIHEQKNKQGVKKPTIML